MYFRAQKKTAGDVSLSECIETAGDGTALSLLDVVCTEEDLFDGLSKKESGRQLHAAISRVLDAREQQVVTLRYGLGANRVHTQREIAARLGISRSYVSRIEKRALSKLKTALET